VRGKVHRRKLDFDGTLNLIFQPAEENEGGAMRMVDEGLFELFPCDEIYALHNAPGLPVGRMAISPDRPWPRSTA
jgi:hippurate hydrolase